MIKKQADSILFLVTLVFIAVGTIMVFSASMVLSYSRFHDTFYYLKKQIIYSIFGILAIFFANKINLKKVKSFTPEFFLFSLVLLVVVLVPGIGKMYGGARRWIALGPLTFQPSEIVKISLILFLARNLSKKNNLEKLRLGFIEGLMPYLIPLGIVLILVLKGKDLGTALIITSIFFVILIMAGARFKDVFLLFLLGVVCFVGMIKFEPYRMKRIIAFANPNDDVRNSDYQSWQALLALGSGGIKGVGFGQSKQKYFYLPQSYTDFIFAIIGEEMGFVGGMILIFCFFIFVWRGLSIAYKTPHYYTMLIAGGITSHIAVQALLNIAVVTRVIPVTGVPLPFISYGGTSLIILCFETGILLNISQNYLHKQSKVFSESLTEKKTSEKKVIKKESNSYRSRRNRRAPVSRVSYR